MRDSRRVRVRAALTYGVAMLVAASYCVFRSSSDLGLAWGVAATSSVSAAVLGHLLGGWYVPVAGERPSFELVAAPLLVSLLAPVLGAASFLLSGILLEHAALQEGLLWVPPMAIAMSLAYFTVAWPAAVVTFVLAGVYLGVRPRDGSNSSFKPTSLRDAA